MANSRSRTRRHEGKVVDVLRWAGSNHFVSALAGGSIAQTFITDGATETIMRIRGELTAWFDNAAAPARTVDVAVGALVVQAGSGTTVIQAPITDPDAPWLFYERFTLGYEEMVLDVIDVPIMSGVRKTIDNKAMRILRPGREVQLVFQQATLSGAQGVNISWSNRTLLGSH